MVGFAIIQIEIQFLFIVDENSLNLILQMEELGLKRSNYHVSRGHRKWGMHGFFPSHLPKANRSFISLITRQRQVKWCTWWRRCQQQLDWTERKIPPAVVFHLICRHCHRHSNITLRFLSCQWLTEHRRSHLIGSIGRRYSHHLLAHILLCTRHARDKKKKKKSARPGKNQQYSMKACK